MQARENRHRFLLKDDEEVKSQSATRVAAVHGEVLEAKARDRTRFELLDSRLERLEVMVGSLADRMHRPPPVYKPAGSGGVSVHEELAARGERALQAFVASHPLSQRSSPGEPRRCTMKQRSPLPPPLAAAAGHSSPMKQVSPLPAVGDGRRELHRCGAAAKAAVRCGTVADDAREIFERSDVDRRGALDVAQLRAALRDMGYSLEAEEIASLLARYDVNGNSRLELAEFNQLVTYIRQLEHRILAESEGSG